MLPRHEQGAPRLKLSKAGTTLLDTSRSQATRQECDRGDPSSRWAVGMSLFLQNEHLCAWRDELGGVSPAGEGAQAARLWQDCRCRCLRPQMLVATVRPKGTLVGFGFERRGKDLLFPKQMCGAGQTNCCSVSVGSKGGTQRANVRRPEHGLRDGTEFHS